MIYGKLLDTVLLGYVFKNANISNNSRLVRRTSNLIVANIFWMVAFKIMYLMHHYLKKRQIEAILRFENHFYRECFPNILKVVQECPPLSK